MTRKEDVEKVRQIVSDVEGRKREALDKERMIHESKVAESLRRQKEDEVRFRATGIVDLFEAIRDEGVVKYGDWPVYETREVRRFLGSGQVRVKVGDYKPAHVVMCGGNSVSILFGCSGGHVKVVRACFNYLNKGLFVVKGREKMVVGKDLSMADAVGRAISDPDDINIERTD